MKTSAPTPETKVSDGFIAQSNRVFVTVTQIGQCDERGRAIYAMHFKGKRIAEPDRPVRTLLLPLMQQVLDTCHWVSKEEFEADLAAIRKYVDGLHLKAKP